MTPLSKTLALVAVAAMVAAIGGCKKHPAVQASDPSLSAQASNPAQATTGAAGAVSPGALDQKPPDAPGFPSVGACATTTIASIGSRLEGVPDSGSSVMYADRRGQVSYDVLPGVTRSKPGDPVLLCVAELPQNCPPGDNRGIVYAATNQRTGDTWRAPNSEHSCGGA